jgi:hypothetical protein
VINREIRTIGTIDAKCKGKAKHLYYDILSQKKKPKEIHDVSRHNHGFLKFVESLSALVNDTQNSASSHLSNASGRFFRPKPILK